MKKEMKYKVLLCLLAGSVLSANTALAAEYEEAISSGNENYGTEIKSADGNGNYTYNFGTDAKLIINGESRGISLDCDENSSANKIIINEKLDISVTNKKNANPTYGIYLQSNGNKEIDRSGGGNINVLVEDSELNAYAMGSGVYLTSPSPSDNKVINIGNADIDVQVLNAKYGIKAFGIYGYAEGSNNKVIMGNGCINVTAESAASKTGDYYVDAYGIQAEIDTNVQTGDLDIAVTASGNKFIWETYANGIRANNGGIINTGNGDINVHAINKEGQLVYADGVRTLDGQINKAGGKITVKAEGSSTIEAKGVMADGGSIDMGVADIIVETIGGDDYSKSIGLYGLYNGVIDYAGGSITASADNEDVSVYAIMADNESVINVNRGTANKVVINGNLITYDNGAINLNLNTADSVLTGSIEDENGTLNLANGARWVATGYSEVNELTMNQGNIYVDTPFWADIKIIKYSGTGDILFKADDTDKEGVVNIDTSSVVFDDAEEGSFINVGVANTTINTLDVDKTEENLNVLAGKVYYDGDNDNLNGKVVIKEGLITPEASGDLLFDTNNHNRGYVSNVIFGNKVTQTMKAMRNFSETAIVAWRQEDSTLSQRLGDLRESDGGQGIWVRMSRGEFNYDSQYENQYNFFQLGYDWARGNWHYGAAMSHNDGETTYAQGTGENRSTSLSLYGTWLGRNGHYADIVLKQGRLSNDFDIYTEAGHTHGDYDMWGTSLSGEYGRKIDLKDGWYVTPQAQMTLMRIGGEDFTTNNGIHVRQDSLESAVGRVGFEVGKAFDKKGSIYAKASLLHDFAGSADTYLSLKGLSNSYSQDIGDTWWEAGLGFNYKVNDSSYLYADVVKTFGGDVETPWQWNVGMRWAFV